MDPKSKMATVAAIFNFNFKLVLIFYWADFAETWYEWSVHDRDHWMFYYFLDQTHVTVQAHGPLVLDWSCLYFSLGNIHFVHFSCTDIIWTCPGQSLSHVWVVAESASRLTWLLMKRMKTRNRVYGDYQNLTDRHVTRWWLSRGLWKCLIASPSTRPAVSDIRTRFYVVFGVVMVP